MTKSELRMPPALERHRGRTVASGAGRILTGVQGSSWFPHQATPDARAAQACNRPRTTPLKNRPRALGGGYLGMEAAGRRADHLNVVADVGHGQCIVLRLPSGPEILYDAGAAS
ncbi:MAG: hypothetical protein QGI33_01115 [Candidatus Brocadiia bacterium]|jgi:hypothetical protein|nr:hypothetical protein [Candidatus Brocadiia bacterium]